MTTIRRLCSSTFFPKKNFFPWSHLYYLRIRYFEETLYFLYFCMFMGVEDAAPTRVSGWH